MYIWIRHTVHSHASSYMTYYPWKVLKQNESTCFPKLTELRVHPSATMSTAWQHRPPLWSIAWYIMSMSHHWSPLNQFPSIDINGCCSGMLRLLWHIMAVICFWLFLFLFASFLRPAWQHRTLRPSGTCHRQCLTKRKTHRCPRGAKRQQVLRWQKWWEWL